ncbi:MAG: FAD-dependent oxidoreductase [Pseudomonadales bacterium]|jgi:3-phenylpropionate/trans-cinnamate dioxygenase ferredoxin reductase subunit|nr:FAD-dependent oxidoreductase [Pseudomonadales bacterium]MDP6470215.1 FAD-dependent oxidoreductase [Pseudomonadales bacterium]MDP6827121.1 FAD-dependent oxidoreductase [Pseudomonadales bacterium]MDP6971559.1 FAD-dependent oxidoreductase [Pseudomonadales bacterium]|tara:strand:+ start:275 stop:1477 length:1203 start_codon:yes stop_codon:yes gene_type:complete
MTAMVIIGAGHAAGQAAASLRQEKYEGEIIIFGDEPYIPYQRPPLSKQYFSGEMELEKVYLRPEKFYSDRNITLNIGVRIESIDPSAKTVTDTDGNTTSYEKLLIATGSRPRILDIEGSDLEGLHYLRTIADVDSIRAEMGEGKKVVIVGGGYIGLEVAAVCASSLMEVHVLEMEERILQRVTTRAMSEYYHNLHTSRGVNIHTATMVTGFRGDGRVRQVLCGDEVLDADLVVIGIGILPNTEIAEAAELACDNGIVVDDHCRTSNPDIYAAGDCTNHPNALLNRRLRLESVPNAMEQARVACANICGGDKTYASVPWFWSDQYELKLQMVGFSADGNTEIVRGSKADNQFAVFYLSDGKLVAADAVNSPKEFVLCRQLVGKPVDASVLEDPDSDLNSPL